MTSESHGLPTLSKSALLLSPCTAWGREDSKWYDDEHTDHSKRDLGTAVHRIIDASIRSHATSGTKEAWTIAKPGIEYVQQVLGPRTSSLSSEVCVGVNWTTGEAEVKPDVKDRNYHTEEGWQYGTADIVATMKDGSLYVGDWKTGGTDGAKEQLLSLACGFQKATRDPDSIHNKRVYVSCLSLLDGKLYPHERLVPQSELDAHWTGMQYAWEALGQPTKPVPGVHCTALYCPHLAYCSAVTGIVEDLSEEKKGLLSGKQLIRKFRMTDKPASSEEAGYVGERITAAKRQVNYYTDVLKDYVRKGGKVVSNGYCWEDRGNGFRWHKSS